MQIRPRGPDKSAWKIPAAGRKSDRNRRNGKMCLQVCLTGLCGPGSDLLSHALRRSTIGARGLNDRVRDGIGWGPPAIATGSAETSQGNYTNMFFIETV